MPLRPLHVLNGELRRGMSERRSQFLLVHGNLPRVLRCITAARLFDSPIDLFEHLISHLLTIAHDWKRTGLIETVALNAAGKWD